MADGSKAGSVAAKGPEWSSDPTVRRMQILAFGFGPLERCSTLDRLFIRLPWFRETKERIERALRMPRNARLESCVRGQGPSRSGKTSAARALLRENLPWRDKAGLHVPWGYLRIPAIPSAAIVGQEMLRCLGDPSWHQRRSPSERLARIGEVSELVGLKALLVDDLHHLVDSRGTRVQHAVADLFIDMGNETGAPFLFFGLERARTVFDVNEQLRGRSGAPIEYLRLDWREKKSRELFLDSLDKALKKLKDGIPFDSSMEDDTIPFRLYCGSGGLLGYLIVILRVAEDECRSRKVALGFDVLRRSVASVVGGARAWPGGREPFHSDFVARPTDETLGIAKAVGMENGPACGPGRKPRK